MAIKSFRDRDTADFFREERIPSRYVAFAKVARRRLAQLDAASVIGDMGFPKGNEL
jgi:plasmid maintenance system killer protein